MRISTETSIRGVLKRAPEIDIICAQEIGLDDTDDPVILKWAAEQGRIILSHDRNTMVGYANDRIKRAEPMSGLISRYWRSERRPSGLDPV